MNEETFKQISEMVHLAANAMAGFQKRMAEIQKQMEPMMQQLSAAFSSLGEALAKGAKVWQEQQKQDLVVMAESGWFPNRYTFDYEPEVEVTGVDMLMTMHLNDCWSELTDEIVKLCPNRKHILDTAFSLHEDGNYVASIPLLISQADGIFCEEIQTFLFAGRRNESVFKGKETEKFLEKLLETRELRKGFLVDILLEPYKVETPFAENFDISQAKVEEKGPNRHAILHGNKEHLDYGTELNSLKSLSLLAFVVYSTKEIFKTQSLHQKKETNNHGNTQNKTQ